MELTYFAENVSLTNVKSFQEIQRMINVFIDLFFEHEGKYYIPDWKSNYLGGSLQDYSAKDLAAVMNEEN